VGGVASGREYESDALAHDDFGDIGADGFDNAGAFEPERERQVAFVEAAAQLRVEQIDASRLHGDEDLAGARSGQGHVLEHQSFGTAVSVDTDGFHECASRNVNGMCGRA
jgi:hypothetical protein